MAVERFPVEAGHILMFARSIGDAEPGLRRRRVRGRHRGRRHPGAADVRAGERAVRRGLPAAAEGRPAVVRLGQGAERHPARRPAPAAVAVAGVAVVAAPGCTPSSTTRTTVRCSPVTCSPPRRAPGERWEKQGKRAGKLVFSETITEYRDEAGELVVTARERRRPHREGGGQLMALKASELSRGPDVHGGRGRGPEAHADRAVRGRVRRLQPVAHRRGVRDAGRRVPERVRARDADDGHDGPHGHRPRRRRTVDQLRRPVHVAGVPRRRPDDDRDGRRDPATKTARRSSS